MSAGTMIACSCKQILMGKHSSLGPVDPHFNGIPAIGVIEEIKKAYQQICEVGLSPCVRGRKML